MNLKKILFSLVFLFSFSAKANLKTYYMEVLNTVKLYCRPDQYFNPPHKTLINDNLDLPVIGMCDTDQSSYYKIFIDVTFWKSASEDIRYELMAHEMTHCLFFENHSDDSTNYMFPVIRDITKDQTKQQLIEFLQKTCK